MTSEATEILLAHTTRNLRRDLVALYDGNAEAALAAVDELAAEPECLTAWATKMVRSCEDYYGDTRTDPSIAAFSWDEVPPSLRPAAARGIAMAYLVSTMKGEQ